MTLDLAVGEYVKQLRRAGPRPNEHLVRHILQAGSAALRPLLDLALDTNLLHEDVPDCYAPLHALRLLGELHSTEIIAPLLRVFPIEQDYPDEQLPLAWADEAAQMIGRLGSAALEPLWAIIDDPDWEIAGRGIACAALNFTTVVAPEIRDVVVAGLLERLSRSEDRRLTSHLIWALARLGVDTAYKDVIDLFRQGKVDQHIITPANARQLLLTPNIVQRLNCVLHPLWERYDQHGPHPPEQNQ
jgi:hypothetical protein